MMDRDNIKLLNVAVGSAPAEQVQRLGSAANKRSALVLFG